MNYLVIGSSCAGKTTTKDYFVDKFGLDGFEASDFIKKYDNIAVVDLFRIHGKDFLAKDIDRIISKNKFVISGFRTLEEISFIKNRYECFVIGVYTTNEIAFARNLNRARTGYYRKFDLFFRNVLCHDYSLGLAAAMCNCVDQIVINNGELQDLYMDVDKIYQLTVC